MIYTVTLNPAIDKTAVIHSFSAGTVNRVETLREDAGGKGINVSKCLHTLHTESVAAVLLAGDTGRRLAALAKAQGLALLAVEVPGQTRSNLKIVDPALGTNTDINEPGPLVTQDALQALLTQLLKRVRPDDIVVLSGSLPQGAPQDTYRRWTEKLRTLGVRVFLDADGAPMTEGLAGMPFFVKPNEMELSRVLGRPLETEEALLAGGRELLAMGITNGVISMGGAGALFLWEDGIYRAKSLSVPVQSTVGAGDSVVAAMAHGLQNGLSCEEQIRLAMAMGAASVMQTGTQAPDRETVQTLADRVTFERIV